MAPIDRTRAGYDRVAAQYATEIGDELTGKPLDRALLGASMELAADPVLDVGGGPGHVAEHLAQQRAAVVHTDLSSGMCTLAQRAGLPSVGADMTALPFGSGTAGGIVCPYAVIHLDAAQRAAAYASFLRVRACAASAGSTVTRASACSRVTATYSAPCVDVQPCSRAIRPPRRCGGTPGHRAAASSTR